jgi:lipoprotein-releasing system ATP-binding protein
MDEKPYADGPQNGGRQSAALLELRGVSKRYQNSTSEIEILRSVDFALEAGETAAVVGASGIGKSTLLHLLGTLDRPDSGSLFFEGKDVFQFDGATLAGFRNRNIGFVFQFHHLLSEFNALENAMMPALIGGLKAAEASAAAEKILVRVGLRDRLRHPVTKLSGGEQQRVALARALVMNPPVLLADEPTGNLDEKNSRQVHELLMELNREMKMTLVAVTHNTDLSRLMARRVTISNNQLLDLP